MKRGRLRVSKNYNSNKWVIEGRQLNGSWVLVSSDINKPGIFKNLEFDLQYDACAFLYGYSGEDEQTTKDNYSPISIDNKEIKHVDSLHSKKVISINRKRNKKAKESRKVNRGIR